MQKIVLLFFGLVWWLSGSAQNRVKGRIIDKNTGEPIEFAVVSAGRDTKMVMTDNHGNFRIDLPADSHILYISIVGYHPKTVNCKQAEPILVELDRGPVDLREVTIIPQSNSASFHTISGIDLNLRPVNSAQDLMRLVPGLFLGQHQGGGIAEHIFFRGFDADHGTDVNVSVDGMPINLVSHAHGQGFSDLHFLIPELVTTYDFGKGPYFAEHGDFTTAGYVAFNTADVLDKSRVKIEGGQFKTGRILAMLNLLSSKAKQKGESAYIAGEAAYTDGPFDFGQHFSRLNLFGKYNMDITPKNKLTITLSTFSSDWRSSGEIPERAVDEGLVDRFGYIDSTQGGYTSRTNAIVKLSSVVSDKMVIENQVYYSRYFFNLHYNASFFAEDSINGDQLRQRETRDLFGYDGKIAHHAYFKNDISLSSTFGLEWQLNKIHNSELSHTINRNTILEYLQLGNVDEMITNAYLDENLLIGKWLFNAGARLDYLYFNYEDKLNPHQPARGKVITSPKINIEYTASPQVQLYLKTGKGFHSNDAKVVVANQGNQILPAAYGADLGINWKPFPHLYVNAALWWLRLQQEFVYDADEGVLDAGDKSSRKGLDMSVRYQFNKWLFASIDLNLCHARDIEAPKGNNYLPLAVPFSSTGGLNFRFANGFNGGLSYRYMKDRPANSDNSLIAKGYFVSDLTANYTQQKYEVGLEIQNLFNTKWREAQFEVESRLKNEPVAVDDISFTSGTPFFAKLKFSVFF